MEEENITVEGSDRLAIKLSDKIKIVREVSVGGYTIPYEVIINRKDLPKGKEEFYLNILTKLL
jgi:hypothetical protein